MLLTHPAPVLDPAHTMEKRPYDRRRDLACLSQISASDLLMAVNKDILANAMKASTAV